MRWSLVAAVSIGMLVALSAASPGPVRADAGANASCLGIESSAISPPGSSDEEVGGRAQFSHELKELGGAPGAIVSGFAKLHAGSHEGCDAAVE
ncbi:MAG TPA: hypothetical protein VFT91_07310 [Dehalococcoidia bacterium]|nr:hypothetical protein [Dehalococcoidia bacterium]